MQYTLFVIVSFLLLLNSMEANSQTLLYETGDGTADGWTNWSADSSSNCNDGYIDGMNNKWFVFGGPNGESYNSAMIYQIDLTAFSSVKFIYGFEWDDPLTYRISVSTDSVSWVPLVTQFSNNGSIDDSVTTSLSINYIKLEQYGTSFSGAYYTKYKYLRLFEAAGGVGLEEVQSSKKTLVGILDLLGRATDYVPNTALIYVYDDGSREKLLVLE